MFYNELKGRLDSVRVRGSMAPEVVRGARCP